MKFDDIIKKTLTNENVKVDDRLPILNTDEGLYE